MSADSVTTLYILRHAEAENNVRGIIGADSNLTHEGQKQAERIMDKLSQIHFDAIISSDTRRTKKTAKIVAGNRKGVIQTRKELRERDYGIYEGVPLKTYREDLKDILQKVKGMTDDELRTFKRYESFETDEELMKRFNFMLKELIMKYKGKTLLLVTHGILMRAFLIHIGVSTYKDLLPFCISNTGYLKIIFDGKNYSLRESNGVNFQTHVS